MGISNDGTTSGACAGTNGYSSYQAMKGNGIAEKAVRACHDPAHGPSVINFNPGPAKIAPSVSTYCIYRN